MIDDDPGNPLNDSPILAMAEPPGERLIIHFQKKSDPLRLLAKKGFFQSHLTPASIPLSATGRRKGSLVDHSR